MAWIGSKGGYSKITIKHEGKPPKRSHGLVAGGVVVACAFCVGLYFMLSEDPAPAPQEAPVKASTKPAKPAIPLDKAKPQTPPKRPDKAAERKAAIEKAKAEFVKRPGALQLPDGQVLTFPAPKEGEIRKVYAYGHMYECDHLGNFKDVTPRKLFHTAFEGNFLALAQEGKPFIPAFLTGLENDDVRKILQKPYIPIGDETEDEKAQLKAYDDLRNAALEYMDQGGNFSDWVEDLAKFERKERQARAFGLGEVMKLVKEGKAEEAKIMYRAASQLMEEKGFKPIRLPKYVQDAFDQMP